MKIRNLVPILFTLILPALLCSVILATCSTERKEAMDKKQNEGSFQRVVPVERDGGINKGKTSGIENITLFALINENNAPIYSNPYNDYKPIGYLHREDVVSLKSKTREKIEIDETSDILYYFSEVIHSESQIQGWIQEKYLDIISIQQDKTATLTNSKIVNPEFFPVIIDHLNEFTSLYGPPNYLENEDDWVIFTENMRFYGVHGLTIHLKNLPQEFDALIYTPDESSYLKFPAEREELNMEEYRNLFSSEQEDALKRIWPVYSFYYPAPFTAFPGKQKTEIRGKDNTLIYSTYLDYPDDPFRIEKISDRFFRVRYCTDTPFYLVVYGASEEDILKSLDSYKDGYKRIPAAAFAVYPETEIWGGILSLGTGYNGKLNIYRIYLYRIDEKKPEDYTQEIKGSWNNILKID